MKFETEKFIQTKFPLTELSLRSKNFYEHIKIPWLNSEPDAPKDGPRSQS